MKYDARSYAAVDRAEALGKELGYTVRVLGETNRGDYLMHFTGGTEPITVIHRYQPARRAFVFRRAGIRLGQPEERDVVTTWTATKALLRKCAPRQGKGSLMMKTRTVLAGSWGEHDEEIRRNGWAVANAPRPLAGSVTWLGPFISGISYAAGPLADLEESWRRDDATLLVEATPQEIVGMVRARCEGRGYDFAEVAADCPEQLGSWAEDMRLPWDQEWLKL
ncbi:hypothetical protein [Microbispora sp. NPDC049125]|uniref:hypothetical protein n=1 Tax=Microbispora sp. NPDC049125 TaxID=3154929 RepID=UPI003465C610